MGGGRWARAAPSTPSPATGRPELFSGFIRRFLGDQSFTPASRGHLDGPPVLHGEPGRIFDVETDHGHTLLDRFELGLDLELILPSKESRAQRRQG